MAGLIYQSGASRYGEPVVDIFCGLCSLRRTLGDIKSMVLGLAIKDWGGDSPQMEGNTNMPFTPHPRDFLRAESSHSCSSRMFSHCGKPLFFSALPHYCMVVSHCCTANCWWKGNVGLSDLQVKVRNQQYSPEACWEMADSPGVTEEQLKSSYTHSFQKLTLTGPHRP